MSPPSSRPAKLDLASVQDEQQQQQRARANSSATPSAVTFVVSGSAGVKRVDDLLKQWKENGFLSNSNIKLRALAYELDPARDDADSTPNLFESASDAHDNLPLTVIKPLPVKLGGQLPPDVPAPRAPTHTTLNYALPTIHKATDISDNRQGWLKFFKEADDHRYSIELAVRSPAHSAADEDLEAIRASIEEVLGKAHAESAQQESTAPEEERHGFFVLDAFASPPLHLASSQLVRSQELADWASFISRLALHPRTYIKLSPLPTSSLTGSLLSSSNRAADALTSSAIPGAATSAAQAAKEAATNAASGVEKTLHSAASAVTASSNDTPSAKEERTAELKRRLRIFLDVIVEAFGLERLIWSANLGAGQSLAGDAAGDGLGNAIKGSADQEAVQQWYSAVQATLTSMGLDGPAVEGIFASNASKVYRL